MAICCLIEGRWDFSYTVYIYTGIWSEDLIGRDVLFGQDDKRPDILLAGSNFKC